MIKSLLLAFFLNLICFIMTFSLEASYRKGESEESFVTSATITPWTQSNYPIELSLIEADRNTALQKFILPVNIEKISELDLLSSIQSREIKIEGHSHEIEWSRSQADIHTIYSFFYTNKNNTKISLNGENHPEGWTDYKLISKSLPNSYIPFYLKDQFVNIKKLGQYNNFYTITPINLINTLYGNSENKILNLTNQAEENFQIEMKWEFSEENYIRPSNENDFDTRQIISRQLINNKDTLKLTKGNKSRQFVLSTSQYPQKSYKFTLIGNIIKKDLRN